MKKAKLARKSLLDSLVICKNAFHGNVPVEVQILDDKCYVMANSDLMALRISFDTEESEAFPKQFGDDVSKLIGFLKGMSEDFIEFKANAACTTKLGSAKLKLAFLDIPGYSWDTLPEIRDGIEIKDLTPFSQAAKALMPFVTGSHFGVLSNVKLEIGSNKAEMLGTDSFRIGRVSFGDTAVVSSRSLDILVPNNVLSVFERLLKIGKSAKIDMRENCFRMQVDCDTLIVEVSAARVEGNYPNVKPLMNSIPDVEWELDATELARFCSLHKTVSDERLTPATIQLKKDTIHVTDNDSKMTSEIGDVKRTIGQHDETIGISLKYILDAINLVALQGSEKIKLGISKKTRLIWFYAADDDVKYKTVAIVVPMR